jgi:hypothetical protein
MKHESSAERLQGHHGRGVVVPIDAFSVRETEQRGLRDRARALLAHDRVREGAVVAVTLLLVGLLIGSLQRAITHPITPTKPAPEVFMITPPP